MQAVLIMVKISFHIVLILQDFVDVSFEFLFNLHCALRNCPGK